MDYYCPFDFNKVYEIEDEFFADECSYYQTQKKHKQLKKKHKKENFLDELLKGELE